MLTAFLSGVGAAQAQAPSGILVDPMRPADAQEAATAGRRGAPAPAGAGVQVILTSPERKLAVIDGKVVPIGGDARGGTLVGLSDSAAVLEKQGGRDVLLMHPAIDKKPPSRAAKK
ncbi:MAG: hypothetical protein ACT4P3_18935 [Betaproteobacteria bacterium]